MSAVEQRLAKVAARLTPTQAVLAWLTEAQAYGSLDAYVASLRDAPDEAFPLVRLHDQMAQAVRGGTQICMVVGGGNIFRGLAGSAKGIDRSTADYMGMLATVMNALAMQGTLERAGVPTRVQSAIPMEAVCEPASIGMADCTRV